MRGNGKYENKEKTRADSISDCSGAIVGVFCVFYGMSRNYEEPEDTVAGVGLSDIMAKPDSGTPADYTPQENAAIALGVIRDIGKYNTEMTGDINANIGFILHMCKI